MELFHNRPLASLAAVFIAVSVAVFWLAGEIKLIIAVLIAALSAIVLIVSAMPHTGRVGGYIKKRRAFAVGLVLAAISAVAVSYIYMNIWYASLCGYDGLKGEVRGYVTDVVYEASYVGRYRVMLTRIDGKQRHISAVLEAEFAAELEIGDGFSANVEFSALDDGGSFDEERYYLPRGIAVKATVSEADELATTGRYESIGIFIAQIRSRISAILKVSLDGRGNNGIAEAVFIGNRDAVDDVVYRDFKYIGALHLLAISGMHLTVVIGGCDAMLRRLRLGKTGRYATLILLTYAYMALTGFSASVVRAGVMMIIYYAAHFARREPDNVTSLFTAAALIMLFSPASAADAGLLLSVTAMLGCIFAGKMFLTDNMREVFGRLAGRGGIYRWLAPVCKWLFCSAAVSVSALLFTMPVTWLIFGRLSLLSPVSTIILTIPVEVILYLCPLIVLTSGIGAVSSVFSALCGAMCRFVAWSASVLAQIDGATLALTDQFVLVTVGCVIITACLIPALILGKRGALRSVAAAATVFVLTAAISSVYGSLYDADTVTYVNYKKNDIFIVTDGMRTMICDVSDGSWTPTSTVVNAADRTGTIDVYMLTHLHRNHERTFERLCRREYVREIRLPIPQNEDEDSVYMSLCKIAEKYGARVVGYVRGEGVRFGSVTVNTIPYSILKRSAHPVIAFDIVTDAGRTVYVGSSVHESSAYDYVLDMCQGAEEVVFGIHGPVYKSGADYYIGADTNVIYANDEILSIFKNN